MQIPSSLHPPIVLSPPYSDHGGVFPLLFCDCALRIVISIRDDSCQFVAKNSSSSLGLCASVVEASLGTTFDIRNSTFESWLPEISPAMRWDWPYQQLIYEKLQAITDGRSKRLMIFLPPRHGKSELVTVRYTAWRLRNDRSLSVILGG